MRRLLLTLGAQKLILVLGSLRRCLLRSSCNRSYSDNFSRSLRPSSRGKRKQSRSFRDSFSATKKDKCQNWRIIPSTTFLFFRLDFLRVPCSNFTMEWFEVPRFNPQIRATNHEPPFSRFWIFTFFYRKTTKNHKPHPKNPRFFANGRLEIVGNDKRYSPHF